jgi:hypothetical protein
MAAFHGVLHCCICFGGKEADWAALECGHVFHDPCVSEWLRAKRPAACPMCRARTRGARALVGVENQLDSAGCDESSLAVALAERDAELRARLEAAETGAEAAEARAAQAEAECAEAARAAGRSERECIKARAKLADVTER